MKNFLSSLAGALTGGLLLLASFALATPTTLPLPSVQGPFLGDFGNNLYTLTQSYIAGQGLGATDLGSVSQTSGQANCTAIGVSGMNYSTLHRVTTSASTGYVCLPTALAGRIVYIANATGQTIDLYSNAVSYTSGTADTINTTAGTTAYTGLTTHKMTICQSPVNGAWFCGSIS
jgi:hypothetical protein